MRFSALAMSIVLTGCASGPPPRIFVLGTPADPVPSVAMRDRRAVVRLPNVSLPDYLDTSDILLRDGRNELTSSRTGRWGERLSVGITRDLAETLTGRLPDILIAHSSLPGRPARDLLVDIETFDIGPGARCVLTARWTVLGEDRRTIDSAGRGTFVATAADATDPAIVAAMTADVGQLADRVAAALGRDAR